MSDLYVMMSVVDLKSVVAIVGGIVGLVSFIMTILERHRRAVQEIQRGARGVSGHWDSTSNLLLIRNDGPLPVTLTNARFIPTKRVFPKSDIKDMKPLQTDWVQLPGSRFLRPGEELAFPCERRTFGAEEVGNYSTLVVSFTDHDGQPWEACQGGAEGPHVVHRHLAVSTTLLAGAAILDEAC